MTIKIRFGWGIQSSINEYFGKPKALEEIKAYGATIGTKDNGVLRVAAQNTNGTHVGNVQSGAEEVNVMETIGIDILGITETKLNPSLKDQMNLSSMIKHAFGSGTAITSSDKSRQEGYLPGGTATLIRGNANERIVKCLSDSLGRYSGMALRGKEGSGALFLTVYRVCQKKGTKTGPNTSYMQQIEGLRERGIKNPDPRNQLFDDLTAIIAEWTVKGYHPIVMGDLNTVSTDPELIQFMETNGLHDLIKEDNQGEPPRTYDRSDNRLDYILGTSRARRAMVKSGALALHDGIISDHTMQWVDFSIALLFNNIMYDPTSPCERQFTLRNVKKKHKFQAKLKEIHEHQKIKIRVIALAKDFKQLTSNSMSSIEMIGLVD